MAGGVEPRPYVSTLPLMRSEPELDAVSMRTLPRRYDAYLDT